VQNIDRHTLVSVILCSTIHPAFFEIPRSFFNASNTCTPSDSLYLIKKQLTPPAVIEPKVLMIKLP